MHNINRTRRQKNKDKKIKKLYYQRIVFQTENHPVTDTDSTKKGQITTVDNTILTTAHRPKPFRQALLVDNTTYQRSAIGNY